MDMMQRTANARTRVTPRRAAPRGAVPCSTTLHYIYIV